MMKKRKSRVLHSIETKIAAVADLASGMPMQDVISKHNVGSATQLYQWRKKFKPKAVALVKTPTVLEVQNAPMTPAANGNDYVKKIFEQLDQRVREHGVRSLTKQDLYTLLHITDQ